MKMERRKSIIPRRKRFTHKKRHSVPKSVVPETDTDTLSETVLQCPSESPCFKPLSESLHAQPVGDQLFESQGMEKEHVELIEVIDIAMSSQDITVMKEHSYAYGADCPLHVLEANVEVIAEPSVEDLLIDVKEKLKMFLNHRWIPIVKKDALHVLYLSAQNNISIQRSLVFSPNGHVELYVHCKLVDSSSYLNKATPSMPLNIDNLGYFVDRAVEIVNNVNAMSICSGYDVENFKPAWSVCPFGEIDKNPYQECRYNETFRSVSCKLLVPSRKWRCLECNKLYGPLQRRLRSISQQKPSVFTANKFLSEEQKIKKLEDQRKQIDAQAKKIARLQKRMQYLIETQGVKIDQAVSSDLKSILDENKISPAQSIFLEQQVKASQKKNMSGMRWHPTMIRLALTIHLTSPTAYEMLRDTGMVKLPSKRTLSDYSRVKPVQEGIDSVVLDSLGEKLKKLDKDYKKYHVLMMDEMHISQNLVFHKTTGRLVGYTSLDNFDREVRQLEHYLNNEEEVEEQIASKVLVYMIKGVSSGLKEVVATYGVANVSCSQMYVWTWKVIGALERSGIAVIALVSDGCSINRAFIKMHKPVTKLPSGVIFDTKNKAAPHRRLFFIADVPHLLKTIRNNLLNSRSDKKKSRRRMMFRGQRITWDYIIKL